MNIEAALTLLRKKNRDVARRMFVAKEPREQLQGNGAQPYLDAREAILRKRQAVVEKCREELAQLNMRTPLERAKYDNYIAMIAAARNVRAVAASMYDPILVPAPPTEQRQQQQQREPSSTPQPPTPPPKKAVAPSKAKANIVRDVMDMSDFKFKTLEQCESMKRAADYYMSKDDILAVIRKKPELVARMPPKYAKATKGELCAAIFNGVTK